MEKVTRPYEVLVRIHSDRTAAAHVRMIEEIVDGGKIIAANEMLPVPLSLAGPEFDVLIPALNQAILATNAKLTVECAELFAKQQALNAEISRLQSLLPPERSGE
jgi:hypothetical protein